MFPPIEPFASGHLQVSDGNEIYWEAAGNPQGLAALYLHGGPGGGLGAGYRRYFSPERYMIVAFEQRGCGRSRPLATEPGADLASNHTPALIADIEALRAHLGVEAWLLLGVSWGTTLALAYAQAHPDRVSGLVLAAITTTSHGEVAWITERLRNLFPREWERFAAASGRKPGQSVIEGYYERILDPDPGIRAAAAEAWCAWEDVHVSLDPNYEPNVAFHDPAFRARFATLVIHYWRHAGFLGDGELLAGMARLARVPGVLIHGRYDVSSPMSTAWDLHRAWPGSELVVIGTEGHGGPAMFEEVTRAIDGFAQALR